MNFGLLMGFFDPLLNWIRGLDTWLKGTIILVAVLMSFLCFAKCINVGKNHADRPIKWVMLGLCVLFMAVAVLFGMV